MPAPRTLLEVVVQVGIAFIPEALIRPATHLSHACLFFVPSFGPMFSFSSRLFILRLAILFLAALHGDPMTGRDWRGCEQFDRRIKKRAF